MFRSAGPQVAIVANDRVSFRSVSLGRDFGSAVEVQSGVEATDQIVVNPNDALNEGATVHASEARQ
jgi:hypothetical protein